MYGPRVASRTLPTDLLTLVTGVCAAAWIPASLWPGADLPAWPSASLGAVALALGARPGRAAWRGVGGFLGLVGLMAGLLQIGGLGGLPEMLP